MLTFSRYVHTTSVRTVRSARPSLYPEMPRVECHSSRRGGRRAAISMRRDLDAHGARCSFEHNELIAHQTAAWESESVSVEQKDPARRSTQCNAPRMVRVVALTPRYARKLVRENPLSRTLRLALRA